MNKRYHIRSSYLLGLVLVISFLIRIWGLDFGLPHFLHPDENKLVEPSITMSFGIKEAVRTLDINFFDPDFYIYPSFLIYLLTGFITLYKIIINIYEFLFGTEFELYKYHFYLIARLISVMFGVSTVFISYKIGSLLRDRRVGLLSALLLSFNFFHVAHSHYYTGDVAATFFVVLSIYYLVSYLKKNSDKYLYLTSLSIGFGMATKYSPFILFVPLLYIIWTESAPIKVKVLRIFRSFILVFSTFFLLVPFNILRFNQFVEGLQESSLRSGSGSFGYVSNNIFYYLYTRDSSFYEPFTQNSLWQGIGIVTLLIAISSLYFLWKSKEVALRMMILYVISHYVFFSVNVTKVLRWLLPIVPILLLFVSVFIIRVFDSQKGFVRRVFVLGLLFCILLPNIYRTFIVDIAFSRTDTRVLAYDWILENMDTGDKVVFEYFKIPEFTKQGFVLTELVHPTYNIDGAVELSRPPDFEYMKNTIKPDFLIINLGIRNRFLVNESKHFYPEASKAWNSFYDSIDREYEKVVEYQPNLYSNIRSGPGIIIYKGNNE